MISVINNQSFIKFQLRRHDGCQYRKTIFFEPFEIVSFTLSEKRNQLKYDDNISESVRGRGEENEFFSYVIIYAGEAAD